MKTLKRILASALAFGIVITTTGCFTQNQTAALITIVGQSVSSLVSVQGNPTLAAQLTSDFTAASDAVSTWKQGSPSQSVVQALGVLTKDLNLIPVNDQTKVYITLAIATIDSIIAVVTPAANGNMSVARAKSTNVVTKSQYKKQWNALIALNPKYAKAKL